MTIAQLRRLAADLAWVKGDPDATLSAIQSFHLNRAIRDVKAALAALEWRTRLVETAEDVATPVVGRRHRSDDLGS